MISRTRLPWPWLAVVLLLVTAVSARETEVQMLSGNGPEDAVPWEFFVTAGRNSGEWTTIPVPSCWEQHGFGTYNYGRKVADLADEQGRYRRHFDVPAEWSDRRVRIVFEGVMTDADVRINGQSAGPVHQGAFYRFHHDITSLVHFGESNLLEVAVSKMSANESVNLAEREADYWVFGGIFRPVWIEAQSAQSIEWVAIDAKADGSFTAEVHLALPEDCTAHRVTAMILDADENLIGRVLGASIDGAKGLAVIHGHVSDPRLWTAETPNLYHVRFNLLAPWTGSVDPRVSREPMTLLHTVRERFGFRTFEVRPEDGLYLNGSKIILKGVNRHCFNADTARTISRAQSYADARLIKEMNMNAVRMSHYPPDKHFLEACDELGLYVLDELAGWQAAYDTPTATRLVGELIRRDVNHPSILFWDNGNEGGWNPEVDGEFDKWDIQKRPVLHPWEKFSGIDTNHYEIWDSHIQLCAGPMLYMPTEFLHGLYDGGIGAGMRDYWDAMRASPTVAGGFFWVFADEGIARTDRVGRIDSAGNLAPDGIVGPRGEKEGSFFTVKEIWSPVQMSAPATLTPDWDGTLSVSNHYSFTNLDTCKIRWRLLKDGGPTTTELEELHSGETHLPAIAPLQEGEFQLPLPADWNGADFLHATAIGPAGEELWTWSYPVTVAPAPLAQGSTGSAPAGLVAELIAYRREDRKFVQFEVAETSFTTEWRSLGNGAWRLDYTYSLEGEFDIVGVRVLPPGSSFTSKRWLGRGPYRVWQNRMEGGVIDVHSLAWNDSTPGETFEYPEFTGYFRDWRWLSIETAEKRMTVENVSGVPFHGIGRSRDGVNGLLDLPDVGLAFLEVIPAMRNKFHAPEQLGPQSQRRTISGTQTGALIFRLER